MDFRQFCLIPWGLQQRREPRDVWSLGLWNPSRVVERNLGLFDEELLQPAFSQGFYIRPRHHYQRQDSGASEVKVSDDGSKFQVLLDVKQFRPDELSVKTVDGCLVVHGKHEEKVDEHGFVSREFTRRYMLPEGSKEESVTSSLSPEGVLTIEAPRPPAVEALGNERSVPIVQTAAAAAVKDEDAKDVPNNN